MVDTERARHGQVARVPKSQRRRSRAKPRARTRRSLRGRRKVKAAKLQKEKAPTRVEPPSSPPKKLKKAAGLLRAAGLAEEQFMDKVEFATATKAELGQHKPKTPVGARLDRARARMHALEKRCVAAARAAAKME